MIGARCCWSGRPPRAVREHAFERNAFTLVELLVVVSIIALLISILLPSLKKAREQAKVSVCMSNVKGISSASLTYAAGDRSEHTVPVHWMMMRDDPTGMERAVGEIEWGGKSGQGEPLTGNAPVDSKWGTANGRGPGTRSLNDVLFKGGFTDYQNNRGPQSRNWVNDYEMDLPLYKCPSDRGYSGYHYEAWKNSELSSYDHYGNSYVANALWVRWVPGPSNLWSISTFLRPVSRVPNPANTVYFMENAGRFSWRINYECSGTGTGLGADIDLGIKGWHGRPYTFVTSFVDAHATMVKMAGHIRPTPHLPFYNPHPDGQPMGYDNWQCVIIRGKGWQIDALPAPPVDTGIPYGGRGVPSNPIE